MQPIGNYRWVRCLARSQVKVFTDSIARSA